MLLPLPLTFALWDLQWPMLMAASPPRLCFTELPGVVAQVQVPNAPNICTERQAQQQAQSGQAAHGYGAPSRAAAP
jgi:hypothetical protein